MKNTYRLLGFAHLSLNLRGGGRAVLPAAGDMMKQEARQSAELADIQLYQGLATFWRGLCETGRWDTDPSLIVDTAASLFDQAEQPFKGAYDYHSIQQGKSHLKPSRPSIISKRIGMPSETRKAIPWLEKYVAALSSNPRNTRTLIGIV